MIKSNIKILYYLSKFNISNYSRVLNLNNNKNYFKNILIDKQTNTNIDKNKTLDLKNTNYFPNECLKNIRLSNLDPQSYIIFTITLNMKSNTSIRGVRPTPGGSLKIPRICIFTSKSFENFALEAGADLIATEKVINDILNNKIEFDLAIATQDSIQKVKPLGRILGPLNLMPSPKIGTVVEINQLGETIKNFKIGFKEFKSSNNKINFALGNLTFSNINLLKNLDAFLKELYLKKPDYLKINQQFIKNSNFYIPKYKLKYDIDPKTLDITDPEYFAKLINLA